MFKVTNFIPPSYEPEKSSQGYKFKPKEPQYFFLKYLFSAALGLPCCLGAFSSCCKRGLLSSCSACFSPWRHLLLWSTGSRAHRFSRPAACDIFPGPGIKPLFSALAGSFLSTTPPGKSLNALLSDQLMNFPGGPVVKNPPCHARDAGSIPGGRTKIPHTTEQLSQSTYSNYRAHATTRQFMYREGRPSCRN